MQHDRMNRRLALVLALSGALAPFTVIQAQDLTLFEPTQSEQTPNGPQRALEPQGPVVGVFASDPAFTLGSASRFGDSYQATLKDRQGQSVVVAWQPGARSAVPGQPGFAVVGVTAREVVLELPAHERCMALPERGVSCNSDNVARLALATLMPLESNGTAPAPAVDAMQEPMNPFEAAIMNAQQGAMVQGPAEGDAVLINPFVGIEDSTVPMSEAEVQERVERARARAERLQQFQPQRIPEDQVPPGMRLVRTPFGDRLVPAGE